MLILLYFSLVSTLFLFFFGNIIGKSGCILYSASSLIFLLFISLYYSSSIIFYNHTYILSLISLLSLNNFIIYITFILDIISIQMILLVVSISTIVHIYSFSYMENDPHFIKFISLLSLFTFFMLLLISTNNLLQLYIGWEGVGLCSYLLINFWYTRQQTSKSAIKSLLLNKIGDIGLLIGLIYLWQYFGTFSISEIILILDIHEINILFLFLILIGITVKSAQIGLHMWLPDAMEGPTPISALIHAATMVTAGVFLIVRLSPIFDTSSSILILFVFIGSLTSLISASIGLVQNDIKKIIAYSTCSQLGYMVMVCGFSWYNTGLFHLINHGIFKALLFLSAGSIIHHYNNQQDLRKYGNIIFNLPILFWYFIYASISLVGLPLTSGYYSKDLIIEVVYTTNLLTFSYWISLFSLLLTTFYSLKIILSTFFNKINSPVVYINMENNIEIITLLPLCIGSICFGYLSIIFFHQDHQPILIPLFNKFLPLLFIFLTLLFIFYIKSILIKNKKYIYIFFIKLWYIDYIINNLLILSFMKYSLHIHKIIDLQILERFGPKYIIQNIYTTIGEYSNYKRGFIPNYLFFMVLLLIFIILV